MENLEWFAVPYNGLETNVEVTKCGRVRKIKVDWLNYNWKTKLGEIDFNRLKLSPKGYKQIGIQIKGLKARAVQVQQLVAAAFLGYKWKYMENVVMHLDDNPLNNNLSNLKIGTNRENCSQRRTIKTGLPVGVCYFKRDKRYYSKITIKKKQINLGSFKTPEEPSQAYQTKLLELTNPA